MSDSLKVVDRSEFAAAAASSGGSTNDMALRKAFSAQIKTIDSAARTVDFIISTGAVDRMNDTISVAGWKLDNYLKSPVVLWAHDSSQPPIARALSVTKGDSALLSTAEFMARDLSPFADTIFRMYEQRFLWAVSVGFLPITYSWSSDEERGGGLDFKEQELLEFSCCPIPANQECLVAAKAAGIDISPFAEWAERLLDQGGKTLIPKSELEILRKAAKEPSMTRRTTTRRADGDDDEDDKPKSCGKADDEECGMSDKSKCSVHGKRKTDDDDEEKQFRLLRRLIVAMSKADDDDDKKPDDDSDLPMEHHDAIRIAHKCLKTAKAFHAEASYHYSKAMNLLGGVAESLDDDDDKKPDDEDKSDDDDDRDDKPEDKAAQLRRVAELRRKFAA